LFDDKEVLSLVRLVTPKNSQHDRVNASKNKVVGAKRQNKVADADSRRVELGYTSVICHYCLSLMFLMLIKYYYSLSRDG